VARQPRGQIDRLDGRSTDVQARDDSRNAHARDDTTRRASRTFADRLRVPSAPFVTAVA
jgi:hypothetical protein